MATNAQTIANRANSKLSTGPTTEAGRARSSLNAVKTGLTGRTVLLPTEDAERYAEHIESHRASYNPVGDEETALVQSIADTTWRIYRVPALEAGIYAVGHLEFKDAFPQETDPAILDQLIHAKIFLHYGRQINNLLIQEARLQRQLEKDRKRLEELQEIRLQQAHSRLMTAATAYRKALETGKETEFIAQIQQIGFEFSIEELHSAVEALKAKEAAYNQAYNRPRAA